MQGLPQTVAEIKILPSNQHLEKQNVVWLSISYLHTQGRLFPL